MVTLQLLLVLTIDTFNLLPFATLQCS